MIIDAFGFMRAESVDFFVPKDMKLTGIEDAADHKKPGQTPQAFVRAFLDLLALRKAQDGRRFSIQKTNLRSYFDLKLVKLTGFLRSLAP